jgi:hypothetical protein
MAKRLPVRNSPTREGKTGVTKFKELCMDTARSGHELGRFCAFVRPPGGCVVSRRSLRSLLNHRDDGRLNQRGPGARAGTRWLRRARDEPVSKPLGLLCVWFRDARCARSSTTGMTAASTSGVRALVLALGG